MENREQLIEKIFGLAATSSWSLEGLMKLTNEELNFMIQTIEKMNTTKEKFINPEMIERLKKVVLKTTYNGILNNIDSTVVFREYQALPNYFQPVVISVDTSKDGYYHLSIISIDSKSLIADIIPISMGAEKFSKIIEKIAHVFPESHIVITRNAYGYSLIDSLCSSDLSKKMLFKIIDGRKVYGLDTTRTTRKYIYELLKDI